MVKRVLLYEEGNGGGGGGMDEKCSTNGGEEKCIQNFSRKISAEETSWESLAWMEG
jgi:hypothetical protein